MNKISLHFTGYGLLNMPTGTCIMTASPTSLATQGMTVRHRKRGTKYTVVANATLQTSVPITDDTSIVIYQGEDGKFWARPAAEFLDGRFENISPQNE